MMATVHILERCEITASEPSNLDCLKKAQKMNNLLIQN